MKKSFFILVILCTFASYGFAEYTAQEIYKRSSPATAKIIVKDDNDNVLATGTGFLIKHQTKPLLVTNYHVIRAAVEAEAHFSEDRIYLFNEVFAESPQLDIAIVSLSDMSKKYLTARYKAYITGADSPDAEPDPLVDYFKEHCSELRFLETALPEIGSKVYVIGSPLGLENTLSEGLISGLRKEGVVTWLQTTAPISPGSSGSPLVSTEGQIVGMATSTFKEGQNLNLAIPSNEIIKLVNNPSGAREIWKGASISEEESDISSELMMVVFNEKKSDKDKEKYLQAELLLKGEARSNHYEEALTLFREAAEIPSEYSYYAYYKLGSTLYQMTFYANDKVNHKYLRDAIKPLEKSISLRSDFPPSQFHLALAHEHLNEYFKASIPANTLINLVPNCHRAYTLRGDIFAKLGQKELAYKDFEKALELYPNSDSIYSKFASACLTLNEYLDAINADKKAIALRPLGEYWLYRFNLGNSYQQAGLYNKAIDEYQKAKKLNQMKVIQDDITKRIAYCLRLR